LTDTISLCSKRAFDEISSFPFSSMPPCNYVQDSTGELKILLGFPCCVLISCTDYSTV
jgi:hypothetical protein